MAEFTKLRVPLTMLHTHDRGPGWTDLLIRDGSDDMAIVEEILVHDTYHTRSLELAPRSSGHEEIPVPQQVVDIGANIGVFALTCVRMGAHVIAVEPEPQNVELLRRNIAENRAQRQVTVMQAAVGATSGTTFLAGSTGTGHVASDGVKVAQVTLAEILAPIERVAVLKIDTEGSEAEILLNCPHELLARCDRIVAELHGAPAAPWADASTWGSIVQHLLETHATDLFGRPSEGGGHIYAHRYPS